MPLSPLLKHGIADHNQKKYSARRLSVLQHRKFALISFSWLQTLSAGEMSRAIIALALAVVIVASPVPQMLDIGDIIDAGAPPTASVAASPTIIRLNPTVLAASAAAAITQAPVSAAAGSDIATSTFLPYSAPTMAKRQANSSGCSTRPAQPTGAGPSVVPDTPSAFLSYSSFAASASSAPVPAGFAAAFTNLNAENSAVGYLGYTLLASYDTAGCANMCNNIFGCQAINVCKYIPCQWCSKSSRQ